MRYCFGECELNETRYELRRDGSLVHVEPQVLDLLLFLVKERGRLISRDDVIDAVWDGRVISDSAISSRIKAARRAIGDDGRKQLFIQTVPRRGFRFVAPVDVGDTGLEETGIATTEHHDDAPRAMEPPPPALEPAAQPERRQLTVLSFEFVGASALSQQLDPEDLANLMTHFQAAVTAAVTRYSGHVAQSSGTGLTAYFGWPVAFEHQAEQAVLASLESIEAVARVRENLGAPLHARIGIATGQVVLSAASGAVESAMGETPTLAVKLQRNAQPDQVVIGPETFRQVRRRFITADLGPVSLDDYDRPVPVWRVTSERALESRFEANHVSPLTRFVGRQQELALLLDRWAQAKAGEGQAMLLSGEAGIGKSRLLQTLEQRLAGESYTRLHYQCSPFHINSALQPVIRQFENAAGFLAGDDANVRLDKLEALLDRASPGCRDGMAIFGALLSLPVEERVAALDLTPQQLKARTMEALTNQLRLLSAAEPILFLFEDAHWIDPTTLEFLEQAIPALTASRILMVITHRPEWRPPWADSFGNLQSLSLNRLSRDQVAEMVRAMAGDTTESTLIDQVAARTDGIPLFVEEITRATLESGRTAAPGQPLVPGNLQASLTARLDRLGIAKEIAQIGAAIGREFDYTLLVGVCEQDEAAVRAGLDQLVGAGLAYHSGAPPDAVYTFKHALVQDAAYDSVLMSRRRELHRKIAAVLLERFPETAEIEPELLAQHYSASGDCERGCTYWQKAGETAIARFAYREAAAHLTNALDALSALPDTHERLSRELDLQLTLGPVLMATTGYASVETKRAYLRAHELCRRFDDKSRLKHVLIGLRYINQIGGNTTAARDFAQQCLDLANATKDSVLYVQANACLGHSACIYGEFENARDFIHRCNRVYEPAQHDGHLRLSGLDPGVVALTTAGWNEWFLGYPDAALQASQDACALAEQLNHPHSVEQALNSAAYTHMLRGEVDKVRDCAERAMAISREHGFRYRIAMAGILHGWALSASGNHDSGIAELQSSLAGCRETGSQTWQVFYLTLIGESYRRAMRFDEGRDAIREAMSFVEIGEENWWNAEHQRQFGLLYEMAAKPDLERAEAAYLKALEIGQDQSAKSWALRAATSLARLWHSQGKSDKARDLLKPIYDWFTEGFDTVDLKTAKAQLDRLA